MPVESIESDEEAKKKRRNWWGELFGQFKEIEMWLIPAPILFFDPDEGRSLTDIPRPSRMAWHRSWQNKALSFH
jgi:hypothetical protein